MKRSASSPFTPSVSALGNTSLGEMRREHSTGRTALPAHSLPSVLAVHWAGAIAAAAILVICLASLSTLGSDPVPACTAIYLEDGRKLVTWVMGGGYASEAGIRAGDVLRSVSQPAGSTAWAVFEVVEGQRAGQVLALTRRWSRELDAALFALGLLFLMAAAGVYLRAMDRTAALRFNLLACIAGATLVAVPAIGNGHPWALFLEWVGTKAGMAAFVHFFLTTPVDRWKPLRRVLVLAPIPILAFYSYTAFVQPDLYGMAKPLGYSYMAVSLLVSLAAMVWPFLTPTPDADRRLWPVLLCAASAAAICLAGSLLPYVFFRGYLIPVEVGIVSLGLIPIGLAWAMVRQPVMGMALGPWALVRTVFDALTDPIFVISRDGRVLDASRAALSLLGVSRPTRAAEPFRRLIAELEATDAGSKNPGAPLLNRLFAGELPRNFEVTLRLSDGRISRMSTAAIPVRNERGQVDMAVLTLHDVTARHELEMQKDEFLANVSHDLRTPLSAIKCSIGIVLANEPAGTPAPIHRLLVNIDVAADRMAAMIDALLELARLQAGRVRLQRRPWDLREIALRSAQTIEPLAAARRQRIDLDMPPGPCTAVVDGPRLERALTNLLSNAQKHGREDGTIRLRLLPRDGEALFAVQDDGPGIPEAEQARIFERFYRLDGRGSRDPGGIGLGLPIARAMVELHGGKMWVESLPGAGAAFWASIPTEPQPTEHGEGCSSYEYPGD